MDQEILEERCLTMIHLVVKHLYQPKNYLWKHILRQNYYCKHIHHLENDFHFQQQQKFLHIIQIIFSEIVDIFISDYLSTNHTNFLDQDPC